MKKLSRLSWGAAIIIGVVILFVFYFNNNSKGNVVDDTSKEIANEDNIINESREEGQADDSDTSSVNIIEEPLENDTETTDSNLTKEIDSISSTYQDNATEKAKEKVIIIETEEVKNDKVDLEIPVEPSSKHIEVDETEKVQSNEESKDANEESKDANEESKDANEESKATDIESIDHEPIEASDDLDASVILESTPSQTESLDTSKTSDPEGVATSDIEANVDWLVDNLGFQEVISTTAMFNPINKSVYSGLIFVGKENDVFKNAITIKAWTPSSYTPEVKEVQPVAKKLFKYYFPNKGDNFFNIVDGLYEGKGLSEYMEKIIYMDNRAVYMYTEKQSLNLVIYIGDEGRKVVLNKDKMKFEYTD